MTWRSGCRIRLSCYRMWRGRLCMWIMRRNIGRWVVRFIVIIITWFVTIWGGFRECRVVENWCLFFSSAPSHSVLFHPVSHAGSYLNHSPLFTGTPEIYLMDPLWYEYDDDDTISVSNGECGEAVMFFFFFFCFLCFRIHCYYIYQH